MSKIDPLVVTLNSMMFAYAVMLPLRHLSRLLCVCLHILYMYYVCIYFVASLCEVNIIIILLHIFLFYINLYVTSRDGQLSFLVGG